ncbi:MAG TPA: hypothetical protein VK281_05945, partial [Xanthobacteraceae bacterium]|nr:hypothetical protein [Xanthobacteraceae bacterium]
MPQFQAEIARKAARLNEQLLRLKNPTGGLIDAARFLAIVVGQPAEAVADRIEILWGLYASLGAYMERNEETFSISRVLAPLDTTALRALRDLIAAAGQWIRAFPTGRRLDDAEQRWWSRSKLESATSLVRSTERKRLVGAGDAI